MSGLRAVGKQWRGLWRMRPAASPRNRDSECPLRVGLLSSLEVEAVIRPSPDTPTQPTVRFGNTPVARPHGRRRPGFGISRHWATRPDRPHPVLNGHPSRRTERSHLAARSPMGLNAIAYDAACERLRADHPQSSVRRRHGVGRSTRQAPARQPRRTSARRAAAPRR
jgi:hypothetical protein